MNRLGAILLAGVLVMSGCSAKPAPPPLTTTQPNTRTTPAENSDQGFTAKVGQTTIANGRPQASPSCFPYHDPRATGPGPSNYDLEVQGPQPLFSGAAIRIVGHRWLPRSTVVKLFLLPKVENAMWYGTQPDLIRCLGPLAQPLGQAEVHDGVWKWDGSVPDFKPGANPILLAVDQGGTYFLQGIQLYGADGLVKPYRLVVEPDTLPAQGEGGSAKLPSVQPVTVGKPFRLTGSGLPEKDGHILIHLDYRDDQGGDWVLLGSGEVQGDRLHTETLTIPAVINVLGNQHPVIAPETYRLVITSDQRPYTIYHILPIQLLP